MPLIEPAFEDDLYRVIAAKAINLKAIVHAIGGTEDHIHLIVSVPPSQTLSNFIGQIKGNSSHFVNNKIKPGFHFAWQAEYGVLSFGEEQLQRVVQYVENQKEHHKTGTLLPHFERISDSSPGPEVPG
jgi:putative transposase